MSKNNISDIFGGPFQPSKHIRKVDPPEAQLRAAMEQAGLKPPKELAFDGNLHRFATGKKAGDLSGWYVAHGDKVPAGAFGDWREGVVTNWRADIGRDLTLAEQMAHTKRLAEIKKLRERELQAKREDAAERADEIWSAAAVAQDDHPYLQAKAIKAHNLKVHGDGRLIAPIYVDGEMTSLQFIAADGSKLFLKGGQIHGGFHAVGDLREGRTVYLCEGVATGLTIYEGTGQPVVMAFSAGNLTPAGQALRQLLGPSISIVVVADNDESGTGQREAAKAAEAVGGRVVMPPSVGMDANDYAQSGGDLIALLKPPVAVDGYLINGMEFSSVQQPVEWLIKGWLPANSLCMIHGPSGSGKTFVALDLMMHIAASLPTWNGNKVNGGTVVYLAGEGHQGLRSRIAAWRKHHANDEFDLWVSRSGTDLNTPAGYQMVVEAIRALPKPPKVITVDTLHRFLAGDENSAQDAKTMIDACVALSREFNCTVILVHHTGVSEDAQHRARGSSAWRGALDAEFSVVGAKEAGQPLQLVQRKQKDAEMADPVWMRLSKIDLDWLDEDGDRVSSAVAIVCDPDDVDIAQNAESKALAKCRKLFEDAFREVGEAKGNLPFMSAAAWNEWTKRQSWDSDGKRRQALSRAKKVLVDGDYMQPFMDGYRVENPAISFALLSLLKR